jgi:hypothetical protein
MRQDFFTYRPTYKLMIAGNHEPALARVDDATRRRFNIIPFIRKPEKTDNYKLLLEKLRLEWPGILRWMINGCLAWQRDGLAPPETAQQLPAISITKISSRSGSRRNATLVQATPASATLRLTFSIRGQGSPGRPATSRAHGSPLPGCSSGAGSHLAGSMGACAPGAASGFDHHRSITGRKLSTLGDT